MKSVGDPQLHTQVTIPNIVRTDDEPALRQRRPGAVEIVATQAVSDVIADNRPVLACLLGRQRIGKSVCALALAETWPKERTLRVWDFDPAAPQPDSRTLSWFLPGVEKSDKRDDYSRIEWLKERTAEMVEAVQAGTPFDVVLDFGGIEETLKRFSKELEFVETLEGFGIKVVALHIVGPDVADLRFLREVEETGVFRPKAAALIVNEALIDPMVKLGDACAEVGASPAAMKFVERGGVPAVMPVMPHIAKVEKLVEQNGPLSLRALTRPSKDRLGLWDAKVLERWLDAKVPVMREALAGVLP